MLSEGFMRSGHAFYFPDNKSSCCPNLVIRHDAIAFKPTKSLASSMAKLFSRLDGTVPIMLPSENTCILQILSKLCDVSKAKEACEIIISCRKSISDEQDLLMSRYDKNFNFIGYEIAPGTIEQIPPSETELDAKRISYDSVDVDSLPVVQLSKDVRRRHTYTAKLFSTLFQLLQEELKAKEMRSPHGSECPDAAEGNSSSNASRSAHTCDEMVSASEIEPAFSKADNTSSEGKLVGNHSVSASSPNEQSSVGAASSVAGDLAQSEGTSVNPTESLNLSAHLLKYNTSEVKIKLNNPFPYYPSIENQSRDDASGHSKKKGKGMKAGTPVDLSTASLKTFTALILHDLVLAWLRLHIAQDSKGIVRATFDTNGRVVFGGTDVRLSQQKDKKDSSASSQRYLPQLSETVSNVIQAHLWNSTFLDHLSAELTASSTAAAQSNVDARNSGKVVLDPFMEVISRWALDEAILSDVWKSVTLVEKLQIKSNAKNKKRQSATSTRRNEFGIASKSPAAAAYDAPAPTQHSHNDSAEMIVATKHKVNYESQANPARPTKRKRSNADERLPNADGSDSPPTWEELLASNGSPHIVAEPLRQNSNSQIEPMRSALSDAKIDRENVGTARSAAHHTNITPHSSASSKKVNVENHKSQISVAFSLNFAQQLASKVFGDKRESNRLVQILRAESRAFMPTSKDSSSSESLPSLDTLTVSSQSSTPERCLSTHPMNLSPLPTYIEPSGLPLDLSTRSPSLSDVSGSVSMTTWCPPRRSSESLLQASSKLLRDAYQIMKKKLMPSLPRFRLLPRSPDTSTSVGSVDDSAVYPMIPPVPMISASNDPSIDTSSRISFIPPGGSLLGHTPLHSTTASQADDTAQTAVAIAVAKPSSDFNSTESTYPLEFDKEDLIRLLQTSISSELGIFIDYFFPLVFHAYLHGDASHPMMNEDHDHDGTNISRFDVDVANGFVNLTISLDTSEASDIPLQEEKEASLTSPHAEGSLVSVSTLSRIQDFLLSQFASQPAPGTAEPKKVEKKYVTFGTLARCADTSEVIEVRRLIDILDKYCDEFNCTNSVTRYHSDALQLYYFRQQDSLEARGKYNLVDNPLRYKLGIHDEDLSIPDDKLYDMFASEWEEAQKVIRTALGPGESFSGFSPSVDDALSPLFNAVDHDAENVGAQSGGTENATHTQESAKESDEAKPSESEDLDIDEDTDEIEDTAAISGGASDAARTDSSSIQDASPASPTESQQPADPTTSLTLPNETATQEQVSTAFGDAPHPVSAQSNSEDKVQQPTNSAAAVGTPRSEESEAAEKEDTPNSDDVRIIVSPLTPDNVPDSSSKLPPLSASNLINYASKLSKFMDDVVLTDTGSPDTKSAVGDSDQVRLYRMLMQLEGLTEEDSIFLLNKHDFIRERIRTYKEKLQSNESRMDEWMTNKSIEGVEESHRMGIGKQAKMLLARAKRNKQRLIRMFERANMPIPNTFLVPRGTHQYVFRDPFADHPAAPARESTISSVIPPGKVVPLMPFGAGPQKLTVTLALPRYTRETHELYSRFNLNLHRSSPQTERKQNLISHLLDSSVVRMPAWRLGILYSILIPEYRDEVMVNAKRLEEFWLQSHPSKDGLVERHFASIVTAMNEFDDVGYKRLLDIPCNAELVCEKCGFLLMPLVLPEAETSFYSLHSHVSEEIQNKARKLNSDYLLEKILLDMDEMNDSLDILSPSSEPASVWSIPTKPDPFAGVLDSSPKSMESPKDEVPSSLMSTDSSSDLAGRPNEQEEVESTSAFDASPLDNESTNGDASKTASSTQDPTLSKVSASSSPRSKAPVKGAVAAASPDDNAEPDYDPEAVDNGLSSSPNATARFDFLYYDSHSVITHDGLCFQTISRMFQDFANLMDLPELQPDFLPEYPDDPAALWILHVLAEKYHPMALGSAWKTERKRRLETVKKILPLLSSENEDLTFVREKSTNFTAIPILTATDLSAASNLPFPPSLDTIYLPSVFREALQTPEAGTFFLASRPMSLILATYTVALDILSRLGSLRNQYIAYMEKEKEIVIVEALLPKLRARFGPPFRVFADSLTLNRDEAAKSTAVHDMEESAPSQEQYKALDDTLLTRETCWKYLQQCNESSANAEIAVEVCCRVGALIAEDWRLVQKEMFDDSVAFSTLFRLARSILDYGLLSLTSWDATADSSEGSMLDEYDSSSASLDMGLSNFFDEDIYGIEEKDSVDEAFSPSSLSFLYDRKQRRNQLLCTVVALLAIALPVAPDLSIKNTISHLLNPRSLFQSIYEAYNSNTPSLWWLHNAVLSLFSSFRVLINSHSEQSIRTNAMFGKYKNIHHTAIKSNGKVMFESESDDWFSQYFRKAPTPGAGRFGTVRTENALDSLDVVHSYVDEGGDPMEAIKQMGVDRDMRIDISGWDLPFGYGTFLQEYRLGSNQDLIAVSVLDILPSRVSSSFFFYNPDLRDDLQLGKLSSLVEIWLTQQINKFTREHPELSTLLPSRVGAVCRYWDPNYYVHPCRAMVYKRQFPSGQLLCPFFRRNNWIDIDDEVLKTLDKIPCPPLLNSVEGIVLDGIRQADLPPIGETRAHILRFLTTVNDLETKGAEDAVSRVLVRMNNGTHYPLRGLNDEAVSLCDKGMKTWARHFRTLLSVRICVDLYGILECGIVEKRVSEGAAARLEALKKFFVNCPVKPTRLQDSEEVIHS